MNTLHATELNSNDDRDKYKAENFKTLENNKESSR